MSVRPLHLLTPHHQVGYRCQNTGSTDKQLIWLVAFDGAMF